MNKPPGYETKFAEFIRQCAEANAKGIKEVTVASPSVLGSNYEELMESLSRLAVSGLSLHMATHRARDIHRFEETGSD